MPEFERYAVYHAPRPGPLARAAASWLGRDPAEGPVAQATPDLPRPLADLTAAPRRYGFHGTLKPPFRLAPGQAEGALGAAVAALAARLAPLPLGPLRLSRLGRFLALVPAAPPPALAGLAADVVRDLDGFRAPAPPEETARRRAAGLSARQAALLERWGYPYVMEEFRFHMTLTGPLEEAEAGAIEAAAAEHFAGPLAAPEALSDLCLFGEDGAGLFHLVRRYPLSG